MNRGVRSSLWASVVTSTFLLACGSSGSGSPGAGGKGGGGTGASAGSTGVGGSMAGAGGGTAGTDGGAAGTDGGQPGDAGDVAEDAGTDGGIAVATFFVSDSINNAIYRFSVTPSADPILTATLHPGFQPAGIAVGPTGELLVAQDTEGGGISRYKAPLTTLTPNGAVTMAGTTRVWDMAIVDDELWASNSTLACSTDPATIVRIAFDGQGTASTAGTISAGLLGADRGILWDPMTRSLFVGQCYPVNVIQHYQVAVNKGVTPGTPLSGNGINNPEGMVLTPWGELLVPNFGNGLGGAASGPGNALLRYTLDGHGAATPNGMIQGNGLNGPCYGAFTPWGELLIVNSVDATLSRFTFDASHSPTAHGTFHMSAAASPNGNFGVCAMAIAPGASIVQAVDGGQTDSGASD